MRRALAVTATLALVAACGEAPTAEPPPGPVARVVGIPAVVEMIRGEDTTFTLTPVDSAGRRVPGAALMWLVQTYVALSGPVAGFADSGSSTTASAAFGTRHTVRALSPGGAALVVIDSGHAERWLSHTDISVGRVTGVQLDATTIRYGEPHQFPRVRPAVAWRVDSTPANGPVPALPPIGNVTADGRYAPPAAPPPDAFTTDPCSPRPSCLRHYTGPPPRTVRLVATFRGASDALNVTLVPSVWLVTGWSELFVVDSTPLRPNELPSAAGGPVVLAIDPLTNATLSTAAVWSSSDTTVVAVESGEVLRPRRPGRATLTAAFPQYGLAARVPFQYAPR